jgi:hypothetical protein
MAKAVTQLVALANKVLPMAQEQTKIDLLAEVLGTTELNITGAVSKVTAEDFPHQETAPLLL